jgi:hypothetical protein
LPSMRAGISGRLEPERRRRRLSMRPLRSSMDGKVVVEDRRGVAAGAGHRRHRWLIRRFSRSLAVATLAAALASGCDERSGPLPPSRPQPLCHRASSRSRRCRRKQTRRRAKRCKRRSPRPATAQRALVLLHRPQLQLGDGGLLFRDSLQPLQRPRLCGRRPLSLPGRTLRMLDRH